MTNFVEYKISISLWTFFTGIWFTSMVFFYVVNGTFVFFRVQEWSVGAMPRLSQIAQSYFPQIIKSILLFIFLICTELDQVEYFTNSDRKRFQLLFERPGKILSTVFAQPLVKRICKSKNFTEMKIQLYLLTYFTWIYQNVLIYCLHFYSGVANIKGHSKMSSSG